MINSTSQKLYSNYVSIFLFFCFFFVFYRLALENLIPIPSIIHHLNMEKNMKDVDQSPPSLHVRHVPRKRVTLPLDVRTTQQKVGGQSFQFSSN